MSESMVTDMLACHETVTASLYLIHKKEATEKQTERDGDTDKRERQREGETK